MKQRMIDFHGYTDCVVIENNQTRAVLGHHAGGRILEYSSGGVNVLYHKPANDGWILTAGRDWLDMDAGRCDIGPEMVIPKHPDLWLGPWDVESVNPLNARMTSTEDKATGLRLTRDMVLDPDTSHLRFTQSMKNISSLKKTYCHWSRTLAAGGGICIIPLSKTSRFPQSYIRYDGSNMNYQPNDQNIRRRDNFLEILKPPAFPKLGMDSQEGWFAYLLPSNLLFVKKYPAYPDRVYGEMASLTISIYYKPHMCELEPIGPMENLAPGQSADFTEDWWLLPFDFPRQGEDIDLKRLTGIVRENCGIC